MNTQTRSIIRNLVVGIVLGALIALSMSMSFDDEVVGWSITTSGLITNNSKTLVEMCNMRNSKGFTIIELMIVVAIVGILASIAFSAYHGNSRSSSLSVGVNGMTETRCINGYMFVVGRNGSTQQMLNTNGGGIECIQ